MLYNVAVLITSLGVILISAGFFTNGIEWVGRKYSLNAGTTGSILAAVGTAMPETIIPLIAILIAGGDVGHAIGIGAILGAPFMLGTLALFLMGGTVLFFRKKGDHYPRLKPDQIVVLHDLSFFLIVYALAILAAFLPAILKYLVAAGLVAAYIVFVYRTVTLESVSTELAVDPLYIARKIDDPPHFLVFLQVFLALGGIIVGAKFFVDAITYLSALLGVPAFIFSLLIAPLATEMPEKLNSIIWLLQKKDTLALGNVTGAMVFQGSIIPAIGIALTPWVLTEAALFSAFLALFSALVTYVFLKRFGYLDARILFTCGGLFYFSFVTAVMSRLIE